MARTPTGIAAEKARTCCVVLTKRCMRDFMRFLTKYNVGSGEATRHSRRLEARCFGGVRFRWNQMRLADEVSTFNTTLQPLSILFETALRRSVRACSPAAPYRSSTASWRPLMDPRASCSPRMPSNPSFARARRLARAPRCSSVSSRRALTGRKTRRLHSQGSDDGGCGVSHTLGPVSAVP